MNDSNLNRHTMPARFGKCLTALAITFVAASSRADVSPTWPTPGDYQIDSDTTTTSRAASTSVERRQLVDGSTGQIKIVMRDTLAGSRPVTQTYPGTGPNKWCVRTATAAPPADAAARCGNPAAATGPKNACGWKLVVETWRRIDDRTWEHTLKATLSPGGELDGLAPSTAAMGSPFINRSANSMPGMPSAKDRAAAMAPVIDGLEETVRTGSAEEKAAAQQQLAILRGTSSPQDSGSTTVESKELWRRVAERCP
jgi:hypothetical protein